MIFIVNIITRGKHEFAYRLLTLLVRNKISINKS